MTTALAKTTPEIAGYEVHPFAARLPMMSEAELNDLVERIRANGQREPAVLLEGRLLDGRNRGLACERLGRALTVREATAEERAAPLAFVLDQNLGRRHLNESQRALIAAESLPELEAEARARQVAPLRRGAESPSGPQGTNGDAPRQERVVSGFEAKKQEKGRARDLAAAAARVGARSVARAKALIEQAPPKVVEDVRAGRTTLKRAEKDLRRAKQLEQIREYRPPAGEFPVIATDPPWKYDDQLDGSDAARGGCPYPPMELEDICALKVPAAKDCILWMWVTNTVLLEGWHKQVLDAWGFTGKTIYTWDKEDIITGHWGRNVTEHVIVAVKGRPVGEFDSAPTLFREKRSRVHSRKPEKFYELVERTCPAPEGGRLEMFSRAERKGWVTTGAELPAAASTPTAATAPLGSLLSLERITGEAQDLGFRVQLVKRPTSSFLSARCGAKGCKTDIRVGLTPEGLVVADERLRLRDHAATHKAKAKKRGKR